MLIFMLNERKSEKAAGASPQAPLGELTALPPDPLAVTGGGTPPPVPTPPLVNIVIRPPLPEILDPPLFMCTNDVSYHTSVAYLGGGGGLRGLRHPPPTQE